MACRGGRGHLETAVLTVTQAATPPAEVLPVPTRSHARGPAAGCSQGSREAGNLGSEGQVPAERLRKAGRGASFPDGLCLG